MNLLRLSACLFLCVSLNSFGDYVVSGCTIEPYTICQQDNMFGADLSGVDLSFSDMRNTNFESADLSNANLSHAYLVGANFQGANLNNINMRHSNAKSTNFWSMNAISADFSYASFNGADFANSNFQNALFIGAIFPHAYLGTNYQGANFSGANLEYVSNSNYNNLYSALSGAIYSESTKFPLGFDGSGQTFDINSANMIFVSEVPLPAGIYLFLSGLVGLGLMRGRNA